MYTLIFKDKIEENIQFDEEVQVGDVISFEHLEYKITEIEDKKVHLEFYYVKEAYNPIHKVEEKYKRSYSLSDLVLDETKNVPYIEDEDDIYEITDFLNLIKCTAFTNDDGFASEVIINGRIVQDKPLSVTDIYYDKELWYELKEEQKDVKIIWYNK